MKCTSCGAIIEDGTKFCYKCGAPVTQTQEQFVQKPPVFCHQCGTELFSDDSFCPSCGVPVNGAGVSHTDGGSYLAHDEDSQVDPQYESTLYDGSHLSKAPAIIFVLNVMPPLIMARVYAKTA